MTFGAPWANVTVETQYALQRTIRYAVGPCDSIDPAIVFDDARVELYECKLNLVGLHWTTTETVFVPGAKRPFITRTRSWTTQSADAPKVRRRATPGTIG
jgi:hypothetical protein